MKRVFASQDRAAIAIVRELLANEGIETIVQNENMSAICGEIPFFLAMPEVCVLRDEDLAEAQAIVERFESGEARDQAGKKPWRCPRCGETIEGQFTICWKCGTRMEAQDDA
jgi:NADPH-dependent glutamate synthase beta subunit-like oxidoreductase